MSRDDAVRETRRAVDATGLTRKQFAAKAGVDEGTLGDFLSGERWPQPRTLAKIESALDWPAGHIGDLRDDVVTAPSSPVEEAIRNDPRLLPEARQHLLNQYQLLLRVRSEAEDAVRAQQEADRRIEAERQAQIAGKREEVGRRLEAVKPEGTKGAKRRR